MTYTKDKKRKIPAEFEQMEPRVLFSAGAEGVFVADAMPSAAVLNTAQVQELIATTTPSGETESISEVRQELVFVDTSAPDYQQLADDLMARNDGNRQIKIFYLDSNQDGIEQITAVLEQQQGIDAIHIISHGNNEGLQLGNTWLTNAGMKEYRQSIQGWRSALNADADLMLYGCNLAGGQDGVALISSLASLTGADIAASDDLTGNARRGGDWEFEYNTGDIETAIAFSSDLQKSWSGMLSITKAGGETPVNTETNNDQKNPVVASTDDGSYVIIWQSTNQEGGKNGKEGIYGQRYDANGNTVGSEFRVNTTTANAQTDPAVAMDSSGNFVVTWTSNMQGGNKLGIYGQLYDSTGAIVGNEFLVNTTTKDQQDSSDVAMDDSGNFVVVWESNIQDGSSKGIYGQLFDNTGTPIDKEFRVNSTTVDTQTDPAVAMDSTGNFIVTWTSNLQDGDLHGIYGQLYDSTGATVGSEFLVNSTTADEQNNSDVAMDNSGNFVVVWESNNQDSDLHGIYGKLYDATGSVVKAEFLINSTTADEQQFPTVSMDYIGTFIVVWESNNQDGSLRGIYGQLFDNTGTPIGTEFLVNSTTADLQEDPAVAMNNNGDLIVAWESNKQDGNKYGIYSQRYTEDNVNPAITLPDGAINYTENDPATIIDAAATVTDANFADFDTGTLTVDYTANATVNDLLGINNEGPGSNTIEVSGSDVLYNGIVIGAFTGGAGLTPLVITFNAKANVGAVQALARNITYWNTSEEPSELSRTVRFVLTDGDGGTSAAVTETINVTSVNDVPVVAVVNVAGTITEGTTLSDAGSITFTDLDLTDTPTATEATQSITTALTLTAAQQTAIEDAFTISADTGNTNNGTINWDYTISEANLDFLAAGETVTAVFTITVDDANGGTDTQDVTINITGTNDAPTVSNVAVAATEDGATVNGSFVVSDVDTTDTHTFTVTSSPSEGSVVNNNDGTFTFDPGADFQDLALGETRNVTFNYTATDDSGAGNATSTAATVTVTVTGTNDTPTVSNVAVAATEDGATVTGSFTVSDTDTTDTHTFDITSSPSEGSVVNNNDGTFTFDPGADFQDLALGETRDVTFNYTATDDSGAGNATSTTATVTVTVTGTIAEAVSIQSPVLDSNSEPPPNLELDNDKEEIDGLIYEDSKIVANQSTVDNFILNYVHTAPLLTDATLRTSDDDYSVYGGLRQYTSAVEHSLSELELWQMIEIMKEQINSNEDGEERYMDLLAKSVTGMVLSLSAGVIAWTLHGGSVLASMLSSVPLWKAFDPLPIITKSKKSESDDETTQTSDALNDEKNAARLLDTTSTSVWENNGHD